MVWLPDHVWLQRKGAKGGAGKGSGKGVWQPMFNNNWQPMFGKGKGKGKGKDRTPLKKFDASQKVWVGGLTPEVSWKELQDHFNTIAKTKWVEVLPKGMACVVYPTAEEAATAIATLNGSVVGSASLQVDVWTAKS
eukprot:CAMPEP_0170603486 /NCGR_PEP_ID=MMETSP0224-20130122/18936_1 /TAXON_ID=285029 /ORGANISM="Togula jolla, Strain CCCM 725" /LENGTH=135 /DNA_ID=CAMNT_0010928367 /DNA_START=47 /DNA_END=454 /DNA_ORIENTATION=-